MTNFDIHLYDVYRNKLSLVHGLSAANFYDPENLLRSNDETKSNGQQYNIYVSNDSLNVLVRSTRDNSVWIWSNTHTEEEYSVKNK